MEDILPAADHPQVRGDSFLTLHYSLADQDGTEYVSTFGWSPATLQMGSGQLASTLERCLIGLSAGERHVFLLAPADAFGEPNPELLESIARSALPPDLELAVNSLIEFTSPDGQTSFAGFLRELSAQRALVDFNHPLAGKAIRFEVEIIAIM